MLEAPPEELGEKLAAAEVIPAEQMTPAEKVIPPAEVMPELKVIPPAEVIPELMPEDRADISFEELD